MLRSDGAKGNDSCLKIRTLPHRSEEHTSELQSRLHLVCRLLLEKKKNSISHPSTTPFKNPPISLGNMYATQGQEPAAWQRRAARRSTLRTFLRKQQRRCTDRMCV